MRLLSKIAIICVLLDLSNGQSDPNGGVGPLVIRPDSGDPNGGTSVARALRLVLYRLNVQTVCMDQSS